MIITNHTNLPEPVFKALTHSDYSRGHSNRSVTQLIDSPRVRILRKEHDDEITEELLNVVIRNDGSDYELIRHVLSCLSKS